MRALESNVSMSPPCSGSGAAGAAPIRRVYRYDELPPGDGAIPGVVPVEPGPAD
jgi:hypothetical protein